MKLCSIENCIKESCYVNPILMCPMHYQRIINPWKSSKSKFIHHGGSGTTEYRSWSGLKRRCLDKNNPKYYLYGNRGIKVCERWLGKYGFMNFLADMGKKPSPKYSIDRINNNGNYEPNNCRWATPHQQSANRRINSKHVGIEYNIRYKQPWRVKLELDKKCVFYKRFSTELEAIKGRKLAEIKFLSA